MPPASPPAPRLLPKRACLFGDSITGYNLYCNPPLTSFNNQYNPAATEIDFGQAGYFTAFNQLSGQKLYCDPAMNKGVPGNTTNDMAARFASDIAANFSAFDVLFIHAGTNDYDAGIAKETTLSNIQSWATAAVRAGKMVVIIGILPRTGWGADSGVQMNVGGRRQMWVNQQLRAWVASVNSPAPMVYVEAWRDLSDPANIGTSVGGGSYTTYGAAFGDGLHPNGLGAYLLGKRINDTLGPLLPPSPVRGMGAVDVFDATDLPTGNVLANPCFLTTTGGTATNVTASGGVPASWTAINGQTGAGSPVASEVTYSTVAAGSKGYDPTLGNIAQFSVSMASGKSSVSYARLLSASITSTSFWTPGAQVRAIARVKLTGLSGFCGAQATFNYSPDGSKIYVHGDGNPNNGYSWGQDDQVLTLASPIFTIPNDTQTGSMSGFMSVYTYWDARSAPAGGVAQISDVQLRRVV